MASQVRCCRMVLGVLIPPNPSNALRGLALLCGAREEMILSRALVSNCNIGQKEAIHGRMPPFAKPCYEPISAHYTMTCHRSTNLPSSVPSLSSSHSPSCSLGSSSPSLSSTEAASDVFEPFLAKFRADVAARVVLEMFEVCEDESAGEDACGGVARLRIVATWVTNKR